MNPDYVIDVDSLRPGELLPGRRIVGEGPDTFSLSVRWSAGDNLFLPTGFIAAGEWTARHLAENADSAEREQSQFVWAMPIRESKEQSIRLRPDALSHRQGRFGRGVIPPGCGLAAFLDLGKWKCHWAAVAVDSGQWIVDSEAPRAGVSSRWWVVDAGVIMTEADHLAEGDALRVAMRQFAERMEQGFSDGAGEVWAPGICMVDAGNWAEIVYEFMHERAAAGEAGWFASKGFGQSQDQGRVYSEPGKLTERVLVIGDRYHIAVQEAKDIVLMHMDVDTWKARVHAALRAPIGEAGSLVLWKDDWRKHQPFARSLLSEVEVEEFVPARGTVRRFVKKHGENHWFDCVVGAFVGLDYLGVLSAPEPVGGSLESGDRSGEVGDGVRMPGFGGLLKRE